MTPSIGHDTTQCKQAAGRYTSLPITGVRHACSYDGSAAQLRQDVSHDREANVFTLVGPLWDQRSLALAHFNLW
mgnify:CR=1 FL=1